MMRKWISLATIAILGARAFGSSAVAADKLQKLNGAQIRATLADMEFTDEIHWRDFYERGGKVTSNSMGSRRTGK